MKFSIGQQVEVQDALGEWTRAIIRTAVKGDYQVTYPPTKSYNTTLMPVDGYYWWPESRIRAV